MANVDNATINNNINVNVNMAGKQILISDKKRLPALLLCFFLVALEFTDFIMIIVGTFKDKYGRVVENWT